MAKNLRELMDFDECDMGSIGDIQIERVTVNRKNRSWDIYIRAGKEIDSSTIEKIRCAIKYKFRLSNDIKVIPLTEYFKEKQQEEKLLISNFVKQTDVQKDSAVKEDKAKPKYILGKKTTVKVFPNEKNIDTVKDRIKTGIRCRVKGEVSLDRYAKEISMIASDIEETEDNNIRVDKSEEKRVELHLHTQMSSMDGVVQAFPEAAEAAKKCGIKVLYGVEAYMVNDGTPVVMGADNSPIDGEYVVLDIETTGLSYLRDRIIEIGAVKIKNGSVCDRFSALIDPEISIPQNIVELTGINDEMVAGKPKVSEVLPLFLEFAGNSVLVAHNARFDISFIKKNAKDMGIDINNQVLDTLTLSKLVFPELKKHKLDIVAKHLNIKLENHHRAVDDAECAGMILMKCMEVIKGKGASTLSPLF